MTDYILETRGLGKRFGDFTAVNRLDLAVRRGEVFAFLGPNGAGKTTTIKMLMGLLQPTEGEARVGGLDCFGDREEVKRKVGYLPDEPVFYDYLTGAEIVQFVGEMHGFAVEAIRERARPLVERLGLDDALGEFAVNYSRGMKKKLGMVCALMHDPELLILDEPTSGLDPMASRTLHAMIRERTAGGRSVFFSTHLLDQAERLCDRVAILYKGESAACGSLGELSANLAEGGSLEAVFFAVTAGEGESRDESQPVWAPEGGVASTPERGLESSRGGEAEADVRE